MARVDLHFHLLPGVDDGPETMEDSLALAELAVAEGTRTIVATPHVRGDHVTDVQELPELVREVEAHLAIDGVVDLSIRCGAELGHDMVGRLSQSELETIAIGPRGARWLLLETPFQGIDDDLHGAAAELRDRGFAVVLAHPERSAGLLSERAPALRRERERGTLLQVNAPSIGGGHGVDAEATALRLMLAGEADLIASDAHSLERGPALGAGCRAAIARGVDPGLARRLADASPARLLTRGAPAPQPVAA